MDLEQNQSSQTGAQSSSVSVWLRRHASGYDCSEKLWYRYVDSVTRRCRLRLTLQQQRLIAAEDLAQEVLCDFLLGLQGQRFPRLQTRQDVLRILSMLISRTAVDHFRRERSFQRGPEQVAGKPVGPRSQPAADSSSDRSPGPVAPPLHPVDEADIRRRLTDLAPIFLDPLLLELAVDRIRGCTAHEMAQRHSLAVRSVHRKLRVIIDHLRARGLDS